MYVEASTPNYPYKGPFTLESSSFSQEEGDFMVSFWYSMYGLNMGTLQLDLYDGSSASWVTAWSKSGNQGQDWKDVSVIAAGTTTRIRFVGETGSNFQSDMAIDDVVVLFSPTATPTYLPTRIPTMFPTNHYFKFCFLFFIPGL